MDCDNCKHKTCWEYAEPCSSCTNMTGAPTNWEPQTNYDRIISKSPEELAEYIRVFFPEICPPGKCPGEDYCYKCWLDWLQQEAP